jgi:phosphatidate cytidylyltransferase
MSTINLNNFWSRTFTGALFVVTIIGSILIDKWLFGAVFLIAAFIAVREFYTLINSVKALKVQFVPGILSTIVLYISFALFANQVVGWQILMINMLIPVLVFINELYQKNETPILNIALTFLGIFYVGLPLALLNLYYNPQLIPGEYHPGLLMGFFVILWSTDTFAYLTGKLIGKHKLFPRISPKKTWEGTLGGFLFGLVAAWVLSMFYHEFNLINWLVIAAIIAVFGTFGDLSESLLKRSLNIKDSGKVLPGHGGMLDRFDAALFASPAVFVYMNLIYYFK